MRWGRRAIRRRPFPTARFSSARRGICGALRRSEEKRPLGAMLTRTRVSMPLWCETQRASDCQRPRGKHGHAYVSMAPNPPHLGRFHLTLAEILSIIGVAWPDMSGSRTYEMKYGRRTENLVD